MILQIDWQELIGYVSIGFSPNISDFTHNQFTKQSYHTFFTLSRGNCQIVFNKQYNNILTYFTLRGKIDNLREVNN